MILGPEVNNFVFPYVDDLLVYSPSLEEHLIHLSTIFEKFRKANIKIKLSKSQFACRQISFLGHIINFKF